MKKNNRIKVVASALAICSMLTFVGHKVVTQTQARYVEQTSWQNIYSVPKMTSNLLTEDQLTIVCEPLELGGTTNLEITVWMENTNQNAEIYYVTSGGYVDVEIDDETVLVKGENIIDVSFEHKGKNEQTETEIVYISITTDSQKLSGMFVFQVQGTVNEVQEQPTRPEILEEYVPEIPEESITEDTSEDDNTGSTGDTTADGTTGSTGDTTADDTTGSTEDEKDTGQYEVDADTVMYSNITIQKMSSNSNIFTETSMNYLKNQPINIGINTSEDDKTVIYFDEDYYTCPIYTRYSIDGGETYIAIAYDKSIVVSDSDNIMIDLTWVNIGGTFSIYALQGEDNTDSVTLNELEELRINSQTDLIASAFQDIEIKLNIDDVNIDLEMLTLEGYTNVETMYEQQEYEINDDTEIIDLDQDETIVYTEGIYPTVNFSDKTIVISTNGNQTYAGTYRLTISRSGENYEEYIQVVFFVNYSDGTLEKNYDMEEIDNA